LCRWDEHGRTPLHYATINGHLDAIRWLVEQVASQPEHQAPWSPTSNFKAAIDHCYSDDMEDGDGLSSPYRMPVLYAALTACQMPAVELLIAMGADINETVTDCGSSALLVSCHEGKAGYLEDVRMLLQHGADVHAKVAYV
jgi:ankyrin repeat protein